MSQLYIVYQGELKAVQIVKETAKMIVLASSSPISVGLWGRIPLVDGEPIQGSRTAAGAWAAEARLRSARWCLDAGEGPPTIRSARSVGGGTTPAIFASRTGYAGFLRGERRAKCPGRSARSTRKTQR